MIREYMDSHYIVQLFALRADTDAFQVGAF